MSLTQESNRSPHTWESKRAPNGQPLSSKQNALSVVPNTSDLIESTRGADHE